MEMAEEAMEMVAVAEVAMTPVAVAEVAMTSVAGEACAPARPKVGRSSEWDVAVFAPGEFLTLRREHP